MDPNGTSSPSGSRIASLSPQMNSLSVQDKPPNPARRDMIEALELIRAVRESIEISHNASKEQMNLHSQLVRLDDSLCECSVLALAHLHSDEIASFQHLRRQCQIAINGVWEQVCPPDLQLVASGKDPRHMWRNAQWSSCRKDYIEMFREELTAHWKKLVVLLLLALERLSNVESKKRQGIDPSPYYRVLHDNGKVLENIRFPGTKSNYPLPGISYQPLDFVNFEFRLLTLLENEDSSEEGQICCELKHAYLDDPPRYHALSYCWGDPTVIAPILVNGSTMEVTTNLEVALRELRGQKIKTIWVDALCINQQDPTERGLQVMRMGLIYSRAFTVLAWLGPESDGSTLAMHGIASLGVGEMNPIRVLFERPYWKRVWIIQEVSKARKLEIMCGNEKVSWSRFDSILNNLGPLVPQEVRSLQQFRVAETNPTQAGHAKRFGLLEAMNETRASVSTDIRDKIYALLGLTPNGTDIVPTPNYIRPAQSVYFQALKTFISKSLQFAYLLDRQDILPSLKEEPDWTNLEIGVPYWIILLLEGRKGPPFSIPPYLVLLLEGRKGPPVSIPPYPLSKNWLSFHPPYLSNYGLVVSGAIYDSINSIASWFPDPGFPWRFKHHVRKFGPRPIHHDIALGQPRGLLANQAQVPLILRDIWFAFTAKNKGCHPEYQSRDYGLSEISYRGFHVKDDLANLDSFRLSFAFTALCQADQRDSLARSDKNRSNFRSWFFENRNLVYYGQTLQKWVDLYSETDSYEKGYRKEGGVRKRLLARRISPCWQDIDYFLEEVQEAKEDDMRLAVTEKPVLTLVPSQTRVGDVVCLLRGADCPIILRPQGEAFVFIGYADHYPFCYDKHRENLLKSPFEGWQRIQII